MMAETGSTNADLAASARSGDAEPGAVLVTGHQSAGRGRRGRQWTAPRGTSVAISLLVAPHDVPLERWTWLSLLAGLSVVEGLRRIAPVDALLKWPNDVLVDERKLCGILAERVETPAGRPASWGSGSTSDSGGAAAGADRDVADAGRRRRTPSSSRVVAAVLGAFELIFAEWERNGDDSAFAAAYVARSATIGRRVRVELSGEQAVEGVADAVDSDGRLVVRTAIGRQVFSAGDVTHLR